MRVLRESPVLRPTMYSWEYMRRRHIERIHPSTTLDIQEHTTYHMDDMPSQSYPSLEMRNTNCFSVFLLQELIYVYFRAVSCEFVQKRNRG